MTQGLLDTATILLNSTKSDLNLGKSSKNYTETFSNGKSFNDIFSTANNNYMKTSKTNYNDLSKKNNNSNLSGNGNNNDSNNNLGNNKLKDLNSSNTNKKESTSTVDKTSLDNQNSSTKTNKATEEKNTSVQDNKNTSKTETSVSSLDVKDKATEVTVNESVNLTKNAVDSSVIDTLSSIEDADVLTDLQNLDDILANAELEDDNVQPDFYINAFYQSTLDSLTQPSVQEETADVLNQAETLLAEETLISSENTETVTDILTEDITNLADENISETTNILTDAKTAVNTLKDASDKDAEKTDVQDNETDETLSVKNTDTTKEDLKKALNSTETSKPTELNKHEELNKTQTETKTADVEVDTYTGEENTVSNDILVKASDNVVKNTPVIDVTKTDSKLSFRDVMEKAGLDEAKLEALNMTVTNVSGDASDGANLGQNSAQEDITRMSLEIQGKKDSVNNQQNKDFSKMVNSKQVQEEQPKETSKNDILSQISNRMQAQNINGTKKITLQLTPESLGKITIEIMKGKDGLQAKMLTDNFQVKEMLEKNIDGLKSTLASQGVTVNNVSVKVASASESSTEFSFGRDNFNGENSQEQDFAGTGEKRGEQNSQYEKKMNTEMQMTEDDDTEISAENESILATEELEIEAEEKIAVGTGNVNIEV